MLLALICAICTVAPLKKSANLSNAFDGNNFYNSLYRDLNFLNRQLSKVDTIQIQEFVHGSQL